MTFEIGTLCTKTAGRDSGLYCVVIDVPKEGYVLVDGQTRRRVINTDHLLLTDKKVDVKKGASHEDVIAAFKKLKIEIRVTKPKTATTRPKKERREKTIEPKKAKKEKVAEKSKAVKKETAQNQMPAKTMPAKKSSEASAETAE